jgi:imidazolonepropionase-like amidohydrolase
MDKIAFALSGDSRDSSKLHDLRRMFDGKRTWVTPTLASLRALDAARTVDYAARLQSPEMSYVDSATLSYWRSLSGARPSRPPSSFYLYQIEVLKTLRKTDTRFLLGTDEGNPLMVAGFSALDELETLVCDGGFSPYDALATATRNVGDFLGDPTTGRIVRGARADLILVDGVPLVDLAVLRHPAGVMIKGKWLDRSTLDHMLESARQ